MVDFGKRALMDILSKSSYWGYIFLAPNICCVNRFSAEVFKLAYLFFLCAIC